MTSANDGLTLRRIFVLPISLSALGLANANDVGVVVQSATDTIYHGTRETGGEPAFAASITWQPSSRFFLGASGRLSPVGQGRQRHSSYDLFAGTAWSLGERWLSTVAVQRREFPGAPKAWQYTEYKLELQHTNGFRGRLDYAPDYYAHDTQAAILELEKTTFLSEHWYWNLQWGVAELSRAELDDYHYARIGGGYTAGRLTLDLSYGWNSDDGTVLFGPGPLRSQNLVFRVAYRLF